MFIRRPTSSVHVFSHRGPSECGSISPIRRLPAADLRSLVQKQVVTLVICRRIGAVDETGAAARINGELVVWVQGRLAFELLQDRMHGRGAGAARAANTWPAHFVVFDLLRLSGTDITSWPYHRRRAALTSVFHARWLTAPWTLCPWTTDPQQVAEWLTWGSVGMEGVIYKRLSDPYRPSMRGWLKYKPRETTEAIVGAITGSLIAPRTLLLGRLDARGRLQYIGRSTTLPTSAGTALSGLLSQAAHHHPWAGWSFSAGWGTKGSLDVTLVQPDLVVEVQIDVAREPWADGATPHDCTARGQTSLPARSPGSKTDPQRSSPLQPRNSLDHSSRNVSFCRPRSTH
ncbi:ATP-dependent DNA ligase [Streptomyces sp. R11]|uniref:ATP-dependent DNA ligase n=1 Tax=Streptomyces sp. R11 TaxID=3238625 RepID=A0AB39NC18_9ACTN